MKVTFDSVISANVSTGCLDLVQFKYSSLYSGVLLFFNVSFLWQRNTLVSGMEAFKFILETYLFFLSKDKYLFFVWEAKEQDHT